jgi:polar amino acid transport system permease protein
VADPATATGARPPTGTELPGEVVSLRHPGRWVAVAVVVVLAVVVVTSLITNEAYRWDVVFRYFTSAGILDGLRNTLLLTLLAMVVGLVLGIVLAVARDSKNPIVSGAALLYIGFFRGTPLLVQLIFWFNLSALYPTLGLGIPFGPTFVSGSANDLITPLTAAVLGLGLNEAAYMAEIVRAGLQSVDSGQTQAAQALGMTGRQVFRRIVLPQALRVIIPPTGNETISMLKTTSLVSVIALPELLFAAQVIYSRTYQVIPLLITASLWYLILTTVLTIGQSFLERRLRRGDSHARGRTRPGKTDATGPGPADDIPTVETVGRGETR